MISSFNPITQNPDNALLNGKLIVKQISIKQKADQINQSECSEQTHQIPSQSIQKCSTINLQKQDDQRQKQAQKEKLGQTEDKLSSLQQKNMRIFNSSMKIKINDNKQQKKLADNDLHKIYGKSDILQPKQIKKQGDFLKVQELSQSMEFCENADQIIMMKSLNEEDFKISVQNPQIKDKSIKLIRSQSKRINLDTIQQPPQDSNLNYFINSELASSIVISPKKSKIVPFQNDHLSNQMNNNNFSQKIDDFNISWNCSSKQQQKKVQRNVIQNNSTAQTNAFGNSIIKQNNNNFNLNMSDYADENEEEEEQQDIVMQSFNTQNHAQNKPKTIKVQLKDLRFFQKSKNIIIVDLQNPTKLEQLKKSKNMQEWFMKRKSQELNQFQNYAIQNNKDINIDQKNIYTIDEKQETEEMVCKICFEGENKEDKSKNKKSLLISPCLCQGSMKYIHQECLKEWIISKLCQEFNSYVQLQADLSKTQCEICKYNYRMEIQLGDRFLPSQAIKKGMKPLYLSLVTFLISCMLFYLAAHFTTQSIQGDTDSMETGYSLGIGVCSAIVGCIFIFISIICLRECLYVKKIITWIIFNSERQKKIDSIQTQINQKTFNGFRLNQIQTTQQENMENQVQVLNQSQNLNQTNNDQSQLNNTNNRFSQSQVMANNQSYQEQESQNLSPSRYSPSQIHNIGNIQRYQNAEDYNLPYR
ncbi:hypothetical protein ABPG74_022098 [Tetrahymena malaccensis]